MMYRDFWEAGYVIFGLHGINKDGSCKCGNPECESQGKHPLTSRWQNTPLWSEEQLETGEEMSQFSSGYGILCNGLLVIDVDAKNGGNDSYNKLFDVVPEIAAAGMIVQSGSGNGSRHIFFSLPEKIALAQNLPEFRGIDFKSNGFVVGCGSKHKSGITYELGYGCPADIRPAPQSLINLLKRKEFFRASFDGSDIDVSEHDIIEMLGVLSPDCAYDDWCKIGMAIHHATNGSGFDLWDKWSSKSNKYPGTHKLNAKWISFGKSSNPVTIGTLIKLAADNGWKQSVTFDPTIEFKYEPKNSYDLPFDTGHCDLLRPPGFIGDIVKWINQCSYYPREHLAVASALTAIGNIGGLKYRDDITDIAPNLLSLCISETATGKESIQQSFSEIMISAGMGAAIAGHIKSSQEIFRNLVDHQCVFYVTDEIGEHLAKMNSAKKFGGASYLEGITGEIMKVFSKANSSVHIGGDEKRELLKKMQGDMAQFQKKIDDNEDKNDFFKNKLKSTKWLYDFISTSGAIPRPFLSLIGYATMISVENSITTEMVKNGFLNRMLVIEEKESNPKPNKKYDKKPFPYQDFVLGLAATGETGNNRIEYYGEPFKIESDEEAKEMMNQLQDWQWKYAEHHKENTGYESLVRRSFEFISKISTILALADGGVRTALHIEWAAFYIKNDVDKKIALATYANGKQEGAAKDEIIESLKTRAMHLAKDGIYKSELIHKLKRKGVDKKKAEEFIDKMLKSKILRQDGKSVYFDE